MIRPISDWVMIDRAVSHNITAGGIIRPNQTGRTKPEHGTVVAVGKGRRSTTGDRMPMQAQIGDVVLFRRFDVEKIKGIPELTNDNGRPYIFIRDRDLWAVVEPEIGERFTTRMVSE